MKKLCILLLMMAMMALAGCDGEWNEEEGVKESTSVEKTYKIGEKVIRKSGQTYVYAGVVGDSIVLSCLGSTEYGDVYTYPIYIEKTTSKVTLENGVTIEVKKVESTNNEATILVKTTK